MLKERKKETLSKFNIRIFITNLFLSAISLFVALPFARGICNSAVEGFRDIRFASYLKTITPEMFLFAFLFFVFDGIYATLHFYHLRKRDSFLQTAASEVMLLPEALRGIFSFDFLAEAALSAAACLCFDGFGKLHFALLLAVCVFRKAAIHRNWYITRKAIKPKRVIFVILKNIGVLIAQIWLSIIIMPIVFPYLWILVTQYEFFANIILLAFIIIASIAYARAIKKRDSFIKNLRALCTEKGFELSEIKNKYSFIFGRQSGANFTVTAYGKKYTCKFIASKMKNIPVVLKSDGEGNHIYQFSIRGIKLLNKRTYFEYGFEAAENERKILIYLPMPAHMSLEENGRVTPISTGAEIWEYKLFNASNFLRCLEWGVVEK